MNVFEILTKFENIVGDSLDQDFELPLANDAMHETEGHVHPEGLRPWTQQTPHLPARHIPQLRFLPSDPLLPCPWIYVGSERYAEVPFERAVEYRDSSGSYYVDTANGEYDLCGYSSHRAGHHS